MQRKEKVIIILKSAKKYIIAFALVVVLISIVKLFSYSINDNLSDNEYQDYFNASYKTFSIRVPKNLNFAGEKTPITDFSVREAAERELVVNTYWQSQSLLLHKRANRWFPIIEPILEKNGIPEDFKYIALIESQLTNAVSPQGATGFWQIIESTGTSYGMEITEEVDERYHVAKSTEVACKYFKEAYKIFNNWTLVAASYNLGMGGVQGQIEKQKVNSYYDLALTEETARYVYRILAMKEIISRPKVYGYMLRKKDLYPPVATKKITVDTTIHNLADFSISQGVNYKILKLFNPWLRTNSLTNTNRKKYIIEIPKGTMNIYDLDGNYDGSNQLTPTDSVNLITVSPLQNDTLKTIEKPKE
ncbi:MAG: lytic transglycosylase domain-containing protein [Bacteroidetes bacterium]|nr:lytic transglycosylase domain-containing protein [Bacteroidota bacterium]